MRPVALATLALMAATFGTGGVGLFAAATAPGARPRAAPVVDEAALQRNFTAAVRAIFADSTLESYGCHVRDYLTFCAALKDNPAPHDPGCPPGVPVTLGLLTKFMVWYVSLKPNQLHPGQPHAASTLHQKISALKAAATKDLWAATPSNRESFGGVPGFALTPAEYHTAMGVIRALGKLFPTGDVNRKLPMRLAYLVKIWRWYGEAPTWERRRDRCWQSLGHQGLLRVQELCDLKAENVSVIRGHDDRVVALQLKIVKSKTMDASNVETRGEQLVTIAVREDECDAVGPLLQFMQERGLLTADLALVAGRGGEFLFPLTVGGRTQITKQYVAETLRDGLLNIGLDPTLIASYSGRSLRAGGATDMRDSGVEWHVIVMQGRWLSDAWKRYFRESADIISHLRKLRPVALDALQRMSPTTLATADVVGRETARLPVLPGCPMGGGAPTVSPAPMALVLAAPAAPAAAAAPRSARSVLFEGLRRGTAAASAPRLSSVDYSAARGAASAASNACAIACEDGSTADAGLRAMAAAARGGRAEGAAVVNAVAEAILSACEQPYSAGDSAAALPPPPPSVAAVPVGTRTLRFVFGGKRSRAPESHIADLFGE